MNEIFLVDNKEHTIDDRRCLECYYGFPKICQCKGLIHCQFVRENWESEKILSYACDNCGPDYKFPVTKKKPIYKSKYRGRR